ncbi:MAG: beta-lactamase family protein [Bacteroidales bacterium]|nr:beta-lactamase family protein [Candidatus Sodaliphilus aphodohippi]
MKKILLLAAMAAVLMSMNMSCKPLNGSIGSRPTLEQRLDSLLDANYSASEPGISLLIAKDGKVLYAGNRGLADMVTRAPITSTTAFNIASISKQFAAVGMLKMQEQGRLSIEDEVTKYFPEFTNGCWKGIKLWHLMSHTSGIPDLRTGTREFKVKATDKESVQYMYSLDHLNFEPGSNYEYMNPTFQLFSFIIDKESGTDFESYQQRYLFGPAGMENVRYFGPDKVIPHMAHGYVQDEDSKEWTEYDYGEETFFATRADGGIYTTAMDFLKWEAALSSGKIIGNDLLQQAYTPRIKVSGSKFSSYQNRPDTYYGYGWFIDKKPGRETKIYHTGDNGGFQAYAAKYPRSGVNVIALENRNDKDRWEMEMTIERILQEEGVVL